MFDFRQCTMFVKKKKPLISLPENFEHRLHIGFNEKDGTFVGLPLQWTSIVGANNSKRPLPEIDPSEITQTEILDLKVTMLEKYAVVYDYFIISKCDYGFNYRP